MVTADAEGVAAGLAENGWLGVKSQPSGSGSRRGQELREPCIATSQFRSPGVGDAYEVACRSSAARPESAGRAGTHERLAAARGARSWTDATAAVTAGLRIEQAQGQEHHLC